MEIDSNRVVLKNKYLVMQRRICGDGAWNKFWLFTYSILAFEQTKQHDCHHLFQTTQFPLFPQSSPRLQTHWCLGAGISCLHGLMNRRSSTWPYNRTALTRSLATPPRYQDKFEGIAFHFAAFYLHSTLHDRQNPLIQLSKLSPLRDHVRHLDTEAYINSLF